MTTSGALSSVSCFCSINLFYMDVFRTFTVANISKLQIGFSGYFSATRTYNIISRIRGRRFFIVNLLFVVKNNSFFIIIPKEKIVTFVRVLICFTSNLCEVLICLTNQRQSSAVLAYSSFKYCPAFLCALLSCQHHPPILPQSYIGTFQRANKVMNSCLEQSSFSFFCPRAYSYKIQ